MFFVVDGVTKRYGGLVANSNVSLRVEEHEIVGLIGPNGAGKSTLFQTICGFVRADEGSIRFRDKELTKLQTSMINRAGLACTFQHPQLFPYLEVFETIMIGAYCRTNSKKTAWKETEALIEFCGLKGKETLRASGLNMFERKRVEIAAALASKPELLLLDELFAGLTHAEVAEMVELVTNIHREKKLTILLVEHVMKVVMSICERVYVLDYGKIIAENKPEDLPKNPVVVKAYLGEDYDAS